MDIKEVQKIKIETEKIFAELIKGFHKNTGLMPCDIIFESKIVSRPDGDRVKQSIEYQNRVELIVKL